MKKLLALLMATTMLVACGGGSNGGTEATTETNNETATTTESTKSGTSEKKDHYNFYGIYKVDGTYFQQEAAGLEAKLKEYCDNAGVSYTWHYLTCDNDPEKCMNQVDNAIADKADAIFICVPDQTMSQAVVDACKASDTLVVAVDDGLIDGDGNKIVPWFGIDAFNIGYSISEWLANYAIDNGLVDDPETGLLYMTMNTVSSCVPRTEGEKAAWAEIVGDKMADRTFEADYPTTQEDAYTNGMAVLTGHPEIKRWMTMGASEADSKGIGAALEELGLDDVSIVTSTGCSDMDEQWDAGNYAVCKAAAYFSGAMVGEAAATGVMEYLLNGKEIPLEYATPAVIVTPENYREFVPADK